MAKFIFPLILIFLSLLSTGHFQSHYTDILQLGNEILKITHNKTEVSARVQGIWNNILSKYPFFIFAKLMPYHMLNLLGLPQSLEPTCLNPPSGGSRSNTRDSCPMHIRNSTRIIDAFRNSVRSINQRFRDIEVTYEKVLAGNGLNTNPLEHTKALYEYIKNACDDPSTCLFHQIAGIHSRRINPDRRVSSTASVSGDIFYTYLLVIFYLLKGYVAAFYSNTNDTRFSEVNELSQANFVSEAKAIAAIALSAMKDAPRDVVREDLTEENHSDGAAYMQLQWYLGQIIVNEANLNPSHTCSKSCEDYNETQFYKYGSVPSEGMDICHGTMSKCYFQHLGYIDQSANTGLKRYGGIKVEWPHRPSWGWRELRSLGYTNWNIPKGNHTEDVYLVESPNSDACDVCTCVCDDHNHPETIRTFSLREVTSNIQENMAITGLRLTEMNGMIYIRIRQGKLLDIDAVERTVWSPVQLFNKSSSPNDTFTLRFPSQNSVNLDTLSFDDDLVQTHIMENNHHHFFFPNTPHVLTGVKFVNQKGSLSFAIRLSTWNARTKTISVREWNNWIINKNLENREKIVLTEPDVSRETRDHVEFTGKDYYVQFQPSDNSKDFGQTTVPSLDNRAVVTVPPMPLSGAGLFYKGKKGYGGVVGLKLVTIDFSELMKSDLDSDQ